MNKEEINIEQLYFDEVISCLGYKLNKFGDIHSEMSYEKSVNFDIGRINSDDRFKPKTNRFVHFTNLKALISILNEKAIRLYNINGMNDFSEVSHYAKKINIDERVIQQHKDGVFMMSNCCNSILDSDDELTLWRLYGNNGNGCCIEFEYLEDPIATNTHRYNVNYVSNIKDELQLFFNKHAEFNNKYKPYNINSDKFILDLAIFHKSKDYKIEKEQRIYQFVYKTLQHNEIYFDFNSLSNPTSYVKLLLDYDVNKEQLEKENITPRIKIKKIRFGYKNKIMSKNEILAFLFSNFNKTVDFPTIEFHSFSN